MLWGQQHPTESWANGMLWGQQHPTEGAGQWQVIPTHILAKVTGLSPWFTSSSTSLFPIHSLASHFPGSFPKMLYFPAVPPKSDSYKIWNLKYLNSCSPFKLLTIQIEAVHAASTHATCTHALPLFAVSEVKPVHTCGFQYEQQAVLPIVGITFSI